MRVTITLDLDTSWNSEGTKVHSVLSAAVASFAASPAATGMVSPGDTGTLYTLAGPIGSWEAV